MHAPLAGALLFACLVCPFALADPGTPGSEDAERFHIGGKASTLGVGIEVRRGFGAAFALRGVVNGYGFDLQDDIHNVEYKGKLKLKTAGVIADWHITETGFRVSAGLLVNRSDLRIDAKPSARTFEFAGRTYNTSDVGTAEGDARFNSLSPYFGVGFGRDFGGESQLGVSLDVGVMFQGEPKFNLDVTCGMAVPAPQCTQLRNDIEEQRQQFEEDTKKLSLYPVLSLGFTMRLGGD